MESHASLWARTVREIDERQAARDAHEIRTTYTHAVYYAGENSVCYLGTLADATRFAAEVGRCVVKPASAKLIEQRARHAERYRPYRRSCH